MHSELGRAPKGTSRLMDYSYFIGAHNHASWFVFKNQQFSNTECLDPKKFVRSFQALNTISTNQLHNPYLLKIVINKTQKLIKRLLKFKFSTILICFLFNFLEIKINILFTYYEKKCTINVRKFLHFFIKGVLSVPLCRQMPPPSLFGAMPPLLSLCIY